MTVTYASIGKSTWSRFHYLNPFQIPISDLTDPRTLFIIDLDSDSEEKTAMRFFRASRGNSVLLCTSSWHSQNWQNPATRENFFLFGREFLDQPVVRH